MTRPGRPGRRVMLRRVTLRHCAKFCADWSNRCGDMAVFRFFKMAAVSHLGFLKAGNFNCPYPSASQNASPFICSVNTIFSCIVTKSVGQTSLKIGHYPPKLRVKSTVHLFLFKHGVVIIQLICH